MGKFSGSKFRANVLLLAGFCLIVTGCGSSSRPLESVERKLPRWEQYNAADAARIYPAFVDENFLREEKAIRDIYNPDPSNPGLTPYWEARSQIPRAFPTLLVDGKGKLKDYWDISSLRLPPGSHALQFQAVRRSRYSSSDSIGRVVNDNIKLEPNDVYAYVAFVDRTVSSGSFFVKVGQWGNSKGFEQLDPNIADDKLVELGSTKATAYLYREIVERLNSIVRRANSKKP